MKKRLPGVLITLLVVAISTAAVAAESKRCALKRVATVELRMGQFVLVPVTLQGKNLWMILNTAQTRSGLLQSTVSALNLHPHALPSDMQVVYGEQTITKQVSVDTLTLGSVRYRNELLDVVPEDPVVGTSTDGSVPVAGFLGSDLFVNVDFELDLAHRTLNLYSQDHCTGAVVYWSDTAAKIPTYRGGLGELYFPIEVEGRKIEAVISTGSAESSFRIDVAQRVFGFDEKSKNSRVATRNGERFVTMTLSTPGLSVPNAHLVLTQPMKWCAVTHGSGDVVGYTGCLGVHPLMLGRSVLEKLHLYFATQEQMLYVTPTDSETQPPVAPAAMQ